MELRDLALFVAVARRGSFAAVAKERGADPSSVSRAIADLERELGVRLFQRTTRRLALTAEGEIYLARARDILALVESAEAEVTASRNGPRGICASTRGRRSRPGWRIARSRNSCRVFRRYRSI